MLSLNLILNMLLNLHNISLLRKPARRNTAYISKQLLQDMRRKLLLIIIIDITCISGMPSVLQVTDATPEKLSIL